VQAAGLLARNIDLETLADMLSGALMYRLLMPPLGENPVGELRDQMIWLLRQTQLPRRIEPVIHLRRKSSNDCGAPVNQAS
jgi:hypothetical protein